MPVQQELSPVTPVNKQINVYSRVDTSFPTSYLIALPMRPAAQTEVVTSGRFELAIAGVKTRFPNQLEDDVI